jgi:hypothetical protein
MSKYSTKCITVIDNGLFIEMAVRLAKDFGKVNYYSPWEEAFSKTNSIVIGKGIPGITRVNDIWEVLEETDCFAVPDLHHGGLQLHLEELRKPVWGSRNAEELELYRKESKEYFKRLGLPVGDYEVVTGMDDLCDCLKKHQKQFVKVSFTREFETFYARDYDFIRLRLDKIRYLLGAQADVQEFIVEVKIKALEIGYDGYCVDGMFPNSAMVGLEVKDKGMIDIFQPYSEMPKEITGFTNTISDTLKKYNYRNFISCEHRITKDGTSYMNDLCCRCPSPGSEMYYYMYDNFSDIVWEGANGNCIDPVCPKKWGAEVIIDSFWSDKNWMPIDFPEEIRDNVKLRNFTMINGKYYIVPQNEGQTGIGAIVGKGNTMEEAIEEVKKCEEKIEGYDLDIFVEALDDAQKEIDKLKEQGIEL